MPQMQVLNTIMKALAFLIFLFVSFDTVAWQCEVNGKNDDTTITPEDYYADASDVVFATIINGHFIQRSVGLRTYVYTVAIFHSFKGKLVGDQIVTFEDGDFFSNLVIGQSYLFTFNGTTRLNFCDFYFSLNIGNRNEDLDSIKLLSENPKYLPSKSVKRLLRYFDEGNQQTNEVGHSQRTRLPLIGVLCAKSE